MPPSPSPSSLQSPLPPSSSSESAPESPLSPQPRPNVDAIKALLNQTMRISTSDGRIFIGTFVCVDKQKNIVLANADEYRVDGPAHGRYVTMVMVPWRLATKVEVQSLSMGLGGMAGGASEEDDDEDLYT